MKKVDVIWTHQDKDLQSTIECSRWEIKEGYLIFYKDGKMFNLFQMQRVVLINVREDEKEEKNDEDLPQVQGEATNM